MVWQYPRPGQRQIPRVGHTKHPIPKCTEPGGIVLPPPTVIDYSEMEVVPVDRMSRPTRHCEIHRAIRYLEGGERSLEPGIALAMVPELARDIPLGFRAFRRTKAAKSVISLERDRAAGLDNVLQEAFQILGDPLGSVRRACA